MARTTPLCPLSTVLAQMKDTNLDFEYEIDETTIWLVEWSIDWLNMVLCRIDNISVM